jgi:hypothetical protein
MPIATATLRVAEGRLQPQGTARVTQCGQTVVCPWGIQPETMRQPCSALRSFRYSFARCLHLPIDVEKAPRHPLLHLKLRLRSDRGSLVRTRRVTDKSSAFTHSARRADRPGSMMCRGLGSCAAGVAPTTPLHLSLTCARSPGHCAETGCRGEAGHPAQDPGCAPGHHRHGAVRWAHPGAGAWGGR